MIAKFIRSSSIKATINYVLCVNNPDKKHSIIMAVNAPYTENSSIIINDFKGREDFHISKREVQNKLFHIVLSWSPYEKERLENNQNIVESICKDWIIEMQKQGHNIESYFVVQHFNTPHPHIHIVASRFNFDGSIIKDNCIGRHARIACIKIENKYNLLTTNNNEYNRLNNTIEKSCTYLYNTYHSSNNHISNISTMKFPNINISVGVSSPTPEEKKKKRKRKRNQ